MSTATRVPETRDLTGEDALRTARRAGPKLLADAFTRLRWADGFSHSRALAFQISLTILPAIIVVQALGQMLGAHAFQRAVQDSINSIVPAPTEKIVTAAVKQGTHDARGGLLALALGLVAALVAGTVAMGQVERGANRIYGVEKDRDSAKKYLVAFGLVLSAGSLGVTAFILAIASKSTAKTLHVTALAGFLRWPVVVVLAVVGFALLFRYSPNRRQPQVSWLTVGALVAVLVWSLCTGLLSLYVSSARVSATYGGLVGFLSLLLWAQLTALAVLYGIAVNAQLEGVRAGVPEPVGDEVHTRP